MFVKKLFLAIFLLLLFLGTVSSVFAENPPEIYLFYGTGCPHCAEVERYFDEEDLFKRYPVEKKEIYFDRDNAVLFNDLMDELGIPTGSRGVPTIVIGNKILVGDREIVESFITEADKFLEDSGSEENIIDEKVDNPEIQEEKKEQGLDLNLAVDVGASVVDAINP